MIKHNIVFLVVQCSNNVSKWDFQYIMFHHERPEWALTQAGQARTPKSL